MDFALKKRFLDYQPRIYHDAAEPFPIRRVGCTLFAAPGHSASFPGLFWDPKAAGAEYILEYAVFYDYDIQHLYDLEHIWVAVGSGGQVTDCWSSFHGMRLRASGVPELFRLDGTHPILYAQPGKHAMMPDPSLFGLHPDAHAACTSLAGGGLLIPPMLQGRMETDEAADRRICQYIRRAFSFTPTLDFRWTPLREDQFVEWPVLLEEIPQFVQAQLDLIEQACGSDAAASR